MSVDRKHNLLPDRLTLTRAPTNEILEDRYLKVLASFTTNLQNFKSVLKYLKTTRISIDMFSPHSRSFKKGGMRVNRFIANVAGHSGLACADSTHSCVCNYSLLLVSSLTQLLLSS